jgi:hypothetical protein
VPVFIFCCFCVSEKLHRKYSQNWTKQKPKFLFTWHEDRVQRRDGGEPGGGHIMGWRGLPLATPAYGVGPLAPSDIALSSINSLHCKKPKGIYIFLRNILQAAAVVDPRSGGSRSSSRHPAREGNHHRRPSSSPCPPLEWCVSSPPLDYGSIAVARWLFSPLCASCLDLVSCLSWSRSSLCNCTCCVCWDPMNIEYYVKLIVDSLSLSYLWSCMLSVASRYLGQVDVSDSKREYLCSIVGSCL